MSTTCAVIEASGTDAASSAAAARARSGLWPTMRTSAPNWARSRAAALPRPAVPPVTITVLPARASGGNGSQCRDRSA